MKLTVAPLTPDRWPDLEAVFHAKGCSVARGCWCMAYRLSGSREPLPPGTTRAQANRAALKALVDAGNPPGLIANLGGLSSASSLPDSPLTQIGLSATAPTPPRLDSAIKNL